MKKLSLGQLELVLDMIDFECPGIMYEELTEFQCECERFDNCLECWLHVVATYQNEHFLKSANDVSEDK